MPAPRPTRFTVTVGMVANGYIVTFGDATFDGGETFVAPTSGEAKDLIAARLDALKLREPQPEV